MSSYQDKSSDEESLVSEAISHRKSAGDEKCLNNNAVVAGNSVKVNEISGGQSVENDKNEDKYDMSATPKNQKSCTNNCEHIEPRPSIKVDMVTHVRSCQIAKNDRKEKGLDWEETTKKQKSGPYDHESSNEDSTTEDGFYEVTSVKERRCSAKYKCCEYLVECKGEYDNTWEPRLCLCVCACD